MRSRFRLDGVEHELWLAGRDGGYRLHVDGHEGAPSVALEPGEGGSATLRVDGRSEPVWIALEGDDVHVHLAGRAYVLRYLDPVLSRGGQAAGAAEDEARAPMPGTVLFVHVRPGDEVTAGDPLVVIESMKLETTIRSPRAGTVATVTVREGDGLDRDRVLVTLAEPAR